MGKWSKITRSTNRALTGHDREKAPVDQLHESLDDYGAHAGVALRKGTSSQEQHGPHSAVAEPVTDACCVTTQEPNLELGSLLGIDMRGGQPTEAGGDPVDGAILGYHPFDQLAGGTHSLRNPGADDDRSFSVGNSNDIFDPKRTSVDGDYPQALLLGRYGNTNQLQSAPMDPIKRTLNLVTGAFALTAVVAVVVLTGLDIGTPERPDLEDGAVLATAVLGGIGLLIALVWTARSGERHADPNRLMLGYVTRLAITEVGALLGILGLFLTGSTAAPYLGLALFLLSLAVLAAGLRRIG
jgi:hypothetical protein